VVFVVGTLNVVLKMISYWLTMKNFYSSVLLNLTAKTLWNETEWDLER